MLHKTQQTHLIKQTTLNWFSDSDLFLFLMHMFYTQNPALPNLVYRVNSAEGKMADKK